MLQADEQAILDFLMREALDGHFESTTTEISNGVNISYNQVTRILERLIMRRKVGFRERGTERKSVRYFYATELLSLWKEKCNLG